MSQGYSDHYLPKGIRLIFMPTDKFKTISFALFIHRELNAETAALNALLPSVLEQGCRLYPDYLKLQRALENLYGAELGTDILKSGERHILAFTLETAHHRYLGSEKDILEQGMAILGAVTTDPLITDGTFHGDYVMQEKNQRLKDIRALVNDKAAYAVERCIATMCADERYGIYRLGRLEDYNDIDPTLLSNHYKDLLAKSPIDLYVVGDLDQERVLNAAAERFTFERANPPLALPQTETASPVRETNFLEEKMNVNQCKLVLGYRTETAYNDAMYVPLLLYSGILGGFPHSKLFMKVREQSGLAYYVHTRLERHKGLMIIAAGINYRDYEQARAIIESQLEIMAEGDISESELENTKRGLINQLHSQQDSPNQLISFHLDGSVGGKIYEIDELSAAIEKTGREEIEALAARIRLDTVYLLRPNGGGSSDNG